MQIAMVALLAVGWLACLVGGLWMLINAFKTSIGWGLGTLLLSFPVGLIFLVKYWQLNKTPFFIQLAGVALVIVAAVMAPGMVPPAQ